MTDAPNRYPLAWPAGRPRTKNRQIGKFRSGDRPITVQSAVSRLTDEVDRLGGRYPLLSTNLEVRMDGSMILNRGMPSDPGVCLYFQLKGEPMAMACDSFTEIAQNIAALAGHIEATRRIERYGVATAAETLQAFRALPPPGGGSSLSAANAASVTGRAWFEVLQCSPAASEAVIQASYRALAKTFAGDEDKLRELNIARDQAMVVLAS